MTKLPKEIYVDKNLNCGGHWYNSPTKGTVKYTKTTNRPDFNFLMKWLTKSNLRMTVRGDNFTVIVDVTEAPIRVCCHAKTPLAALRKAYKICGKNNTSKK